MCFAAWRIAITEAPAHVPDPAPAQSRALLLFWGFGSWSQWVGVEKGVEAVLGFSSSPPSHAVPCSKGPRGIEPKELHSFFLPSKSFKWLHVSVSSSTQMPQDAVLMSGRG